MRKVTNIYEARVPVTHYQGDSRAEWVVRVDKVGRTYSVSGSEYAFCDVDDRIIEAIFEPYEDLLCETFDELGKGSPRKLTRKSTWSCIGSPNTYLAGVKAKETAIQMGKWLEAVARAAIESIPSHVLDRNNMFIKTNTDDEKAMMPAIEMARAYSSKDKLTQ